MFSLLSPVLHHTIPAGANLRLTVYQCITHLHLSNLGLNLLPSPREGAMEQEKGRTGERIEREKLVCVSKDCFLSMWIKKWECDSRRGRAETSFHCGCVCECLYGPCWTKVSHVWRSQLQATKTLNCQTQLYCDLLCCCVCVFWDIWWRLIWLWSLKVKAL